MACAWWQTGFWRDSETLWRHALDCTTGNAIAYNNLGALLGEAGKIDEARDNFVAALKFDPQYLRAQVNLAKTMTRQGKPDAAVDMFLQILAKHPDNYQAQLGIGIALMQQQRLDDATAHFRTALKLDPDPAGANNRLVNLLLSQAGCLDEAITIARDGVLFQPDSVAAHLSLAQALMRKGDVNGAIPEYQRVAELKPKDPAIHRFLADLRRQRGAACRDLGTALLQQRKIDAAIECYLKAVKIDPSAPEGHANLAGLLYLQGKRPEAVAQWLEALRLQPDNATLLRAVAWVLAASPEADARDGAEGPGTGPAGRGSPTAESRSSSTPWRPRMLRPGNMPRQWTLPAPPTPWRANRPTAALADAISARIKLYENKSPFRDERLAAPPAKKP